MERVKIDLGDDGGAVWLAFSREVSGKTGLQVEAVPLHIDYPIERTIEARERFDALHVEAAIKSFREFPFPHRPR